MNSGLTFAFLVVVAVLISKLVHAWIESRNTKSSPDEEMLETLGKIDQLEERIQVLERIITESRYDLKREIDSL